MDGTAEARQGQHRGVGEGTGMAIWENRWAPPPPPPLRKRGARSLAVALGGPVVPLVVGLRLLREEHLVQAGGDRGAVGAGARGSPQPTGLRGLETTCSRQGLRGISQSLGRPDPTAEPVSPARGTSLAGRPAPAHGHIQRGRLPWAGPREGAAVEAERASPYQCT